jgi:4-alpha-glucanotransferase
MPSGIQVEGLRKLKRELKAVEDGLQKELARANKRVTAGIIVPAAVSNASARTNPRWGHLAINTLRALATQEKAQVAVGSNKVTWAAGHNFGSKHERITNGRHSVNQFPPSKGYRRGDYALYEAIEEKAGESLEEWTRALDDLLARSFPS